ncbi:MAG: response regulator transcription factor [Candidatus Firestonebacteria bacterium]|nr:response regulator transcription factor [Candidatus Firestonebacteria bacterium]
MIKIIIADDHIIFSEGLVKMLSNEKDIIVTGQAKEGNEALRLIIDNKPDIAIIDISMPGISGLEIAEKVQNNKLNTKIIFLTMHNDSQIVNKALKSGISGYVLKENAFHDLVYAIKKVSSGEKFISPSILENKQTKNKDTILSEREKEILKLIASGLTNKEISNKLFISIKTVETHRMRIMEKLDLHNTSSLVKYAIENENL